MLLGASAPPPSNGRGTPLSHPLLLIVINNFYCSADKYRMATLSLPLSPSKAALSKLKSQLTCPICLDQYTDPRVLPCAHCYCKDCIDHLPVELENGRYVVRCPTCRQPSELRERGASSLPVAFHINNLLEIDQLLKKASFVQCCHAHGNKPMDLYCETCEEHICFKCSTEFHRDHMCDRAEDLFIKHKQQIEACLKPVKEQIDVVKQILNHFDTREREMREQEEVVQKKINDIYQQLMSELQESKRRLSQEAAAALQEKLQLHSLQRSSVEAVLEKLKSCCEFIEEELRSQSQYQILAAKKELVKHINNTRSEVKVSELQPAQEPNIAFTAALSANNYLGDITSKQHGVFSVNIPSHVMVHRQIAVSITALIPVPFSSRRLSCQLVSPYAKPVVCPITTVGESQFKVMFQSNTIGLHQLRLLVEGVDIYGSPFSVHVAKWKRHDLVRLAEDFRGPWGIAVTDDGQYLVITEKRSHCVTVLSCNTGEVVKKIEGDSEFVGPCGIAVSADNRIFVAYKSGRLRVLDCSSSYEASCKVECTGVAVRNGKVYCIDDTVITVLNASDLTPLDATLCKYNNTFDGFLARFCNINTDSKGVLYAIGHYAFDQHMRVVRYTHDKNRFTTVFDGQFGDPFGICIDSDDIMYVTDRREHKVMAFNKEGKYIGSFGRSGRSPLNPCGVAVDKTGNVYVCDNVTGEVLVSRPH